MITKYGEFLKIYEIYSGTEYPYTSISSRINYAISQGYNPSLLKSMIGEIIKQNKGQDLVQKIDKDSEEFKYMSFINNVIETCREDGYWDEWIFKDLEKVYNEMK